MFFFKSRTAVKTFCLIREEKGEDHTQQHNFHIFPSRGGRFNKVWMSMTNAGARLKVGEGMSETTVSTSQLFTWDVYLAVLALRPSAIVKILAQTGVFISWGSLWQMAVASEKVLWRVPATVLYICLSSLLVLSELSLTCVGQFSFEGLRNLFSVSSSNCFLHVSFPLIPRPANPLVQCFAWVSLGWNIWGFSPHDLVQTCDSSGWTNLAGHL